MAGPVAVGPGRVLSLTISADTSAYADNDLLFDTQEVVQAFLRPGGQLLLHSLTLLDQDDQGVAIDLVFLDDSGSLGTENAAVSVTDAVAQGIGAVVPIAVSDYTDLVNSQVASVENLGIMLQAASSDTSLYVAGIVRSGTPTYTASGLILKLGVMWLA
jgi:hypothetical protein